MNPVFIVCIAAVAIVAAFIGIAIYILCRKIRRACRHSKEKQSVEGEDHKSSFILVTLFIHLFDVK
jgi:hypothetical protein